MPVEEIVIGFKTSGVEEVIRKMMGISEIAKQISNEVLNKQKELVNFSNRMKQNWERQGLAVRNLADRTRKFRMELLSVMFFGMGLDRMFSGLLKPTLDLVGAFDIFDLTLGIFFLRNGINVLNWAIWLNEKLLDLSPSLQLFIGNVVLIGDILAKLLFGFAMWGLALDGLKMTFGPLIAAIQYAGGIFAWLGGIFTTGVLIWLALVVFALIGFWMAWRDNFGNIREWVALIWEGIKQIFTGIWQVISGIAKIIIGFFSGDTAKIKEGAKLLWEGVKNIFWGFLKFVGGFIVTLGISLWMGLLGILRSITAILGAGFGLIWENLLKPAWDFGVNLIKSIIEGIKSMIEEAKALLADLIPGGKTGAQVRAKTKTAKLGGGQSGISYVPQTGLYKLHAGESVQTAGDTFNSSPVINVYGSGLSTDDLVRKISEAVTRDLASLSRR